MASAVPMALVPRPPRSTDFPEPARSFALSASRAGCRRFAAPDRWRQRGSPPTGDRSLYATGCSPPAGLTAVTGHGWPAHPPVRRNPGAGNHPSRDPGRTAGYETEESLSNGLVLPRSRVNELPCTEHLVVGWLMLQYCSFMVSHVLRFATHKQNYVPMRYRIMH